MRSRGGTRCRPIGGLRRPPHPPRPARRAERSSPRQEPAFRAAFALPREKLLGWLSARLKCSSTTALMSPWK